MEEVRYLRFVNAALRVFARRMGEEQDNPDWAAGHRAVSAWARHLSVEHRDPSNLPSLDALMAWKPETALGHSMESQREWRLLRLFYRRWRGSGPRVTDADVRGIEEIVEGLFGLPVQQITMLSSDTFALDFGALAEGGERGEWHLRVLMAEWRLENDVEVVATSDQPSVYLRQALRALNDRVLDRVVVQAPGLETTLHFGDLRLRLFPIHPETEEELHDWRLWTPDGRALSVGTGSTWSFAEATLVEDDLPGQRPVRLERVAHLPGHGPTDFAQCLGYSASTVRYFAHRKDEEPENPDWAAGHEAALRWGRYLRSKKQRPDDLAALDALVEKGVAEAHHSIHSERAWGTLRFLYRRWSDGVPRMTGEDARVIEEIVAPLRGRAAWQVKHGVGSFITMDFGAPVANGDYGEWHLWVAMVRWRLENDTEVVAACEYPDAFFQQAIQELEGRPLTGVAVQAPSLDTTLHFGDLRLRLFPVEREDPDGLGDWKLWTPHGKVLQVGEGQAWSYAP